MPNKAFDVESAIQFLPSSQNITEMSVRRNATQGEMLSVTQIGDTYTRKIVPIPSVRIIVARPSTRRLQPDCGCTAGEAHATIRGPEQSPPARATGDHRWRRQHVKTRIYGQKLPVGITAPSGATRTNSRTGKRPSHAYRTRTRTPSRLVGSTVLGRGSG